MHVDDMEKGGRGHEIEQSRAQRATIDGGGSMRQRGGAPFCAVIGRAEGRAAGLSEPR